MPDTFHIFHIMCRERGKVATVASLTKERAEHLASLAVLSFHKDAKRQVSTRNPLFRYVEAA